MAKRSRMRSLRATFLAWTPEKGFVTTRMDFSPKDVIFGERIATMIRETPDHKKNIRDVMQKIKQESASNANFREWLDSITDARLQGIVEFCYFKRPPRRSGKANKNVTHG